MGKENESCLKKQNKKQTKKKNKNNNQLTMNSKRGCEKPISLSQTIHRTLIVAVEENWTKEVVYKVSEENYENEIGQRSKILIKYKKFLKLYICEGK